MDFKLEQQQQQVQKEKKKKKPASQHVCQSWTKTLNIKITNKNKKQTIDLNDDFD